LEKLGWVSKLVGRVGLGEEKVTCVCLCAKANTTKQKLPCLLK